MIDLAFGLAFAREYFLQYQPPDATEADMSLLGELLRAILQYNLADSQLLKSYWNLSSSNEGLK